MRSVLVTGCSSGFGLSIAVTLARREWLVFASMRNLDKRGALDTAAAEAGVPSDRLRVMQLDVTDQASIDWAVADLRTGDGHPLRAVVHNAGVSGGGAFEDIPDEVVRRVFETNFFGVLALTRAVLPIFRAARQGRIVVMSSSSAFSGNPAVSPYSASKFAIEGWAESVAYELEPFGIQVALVEPGAYRTEIWKTSPRVKPPDSAYRALTDIVEPNVERRVVGRARDPQEVADAVARVLEARRPRFRNPVGPDSVAQWVARGILPYRARKAIISRVLGINRWKP